jgi:hypothetical protein
MKGKERAKRTVSKGKLTVIWDSFYSFLFRSKKKLFSIQLLLLLDFAPLQKKKGLCPSTDAPM